MAPQGYFYFGAPFLYYDVFLQVKLNLDKYIFLGGSIGEQRP